MAYIHLVAVVDARDAADGEEEEVSEVVVPAHALSLELSCDARDIVVGQEVDEGHVTVQSLQTAHNVRPAQTAKRSQTLKNEAGRCKTRPDAAKRSS